MAKVGKSKDYDEKYYEDNSQNKDRLANKFFSNLLKKYLKKGKILEYGCGAGFFINKFEPSNYKKYAFDISEYALKQTQENDPAATIIRNPNKEIKKHSLDCVAALHVFEHLEDPEKSISEVSTLIKNKGFLFFTVPNTSSIGRKIKKDKWFGYRDDTHISMLEVNEWVRIVENNGFTVLKIGSDGLWDVPYIKYVPIIIQKLIFYPTSAIQVLFRNVFLPIWSGENLIIIARKDQ